MIRADTQRWQRWLLKGKERTALRYNGCSISWSELNKKLDILAYSLRDQGVVRGCVIAAVSKNCIELLLLYLAAMKLGALVSCIAPAPLSQLERKFTTLGCRFIWLGNGVDAKLRYVLPSSYHQLKIMDSKFACSSPHFSSASHPQGLASVVFTSGSTGEPKAVAHTAAQHLASAKGLLSRFEFNQSDLWLLSLPMFHVSGLAIVWRWLLVGGCLKIGEGKDLYKDISGVTHASLVVTQLQRILAQSDTVSLKRVLLGGSHIPVELAEVARERGIDTWLGYGMTEAASTVMAKRVDGQEGVGFLLPYRTLKIEAQNILIGGETLAAGYFQRGELIPISESGWFESKDLGYWRGEELVVLGRADNCFISGGENIHCEEIEAVLNQYSHIQSSVVIPVWDKEFGARPYAVINSVDGLDQTALTQHLRQKLEKFKWPIGYSEMPQTLSQSMAIKIQRSAIKEWFFQSHSQYKKI